MNPQPPHLPPPACRMDTHHRLQNLRWILFIFIISFLSGLTAALVVVAWIVPSAGEMAGFYLDGYNFSDNHATALDPTLAYQLEQKTVRIFSKKSLADKMAVKNSELAYGALISSDGWAVFYYPAYASGLEKGWVVADNQGILYNLKKAVFDNYSQLLYLQVAGQGFRVNSFFDWSSVQSEMALWAMGERWQIVEAKNVSEGRNNLRGSDLVLSRKLSVAVKAGALLYTSNGDLAGLADKQGKVVPCWVIETQVGNLLSKQKIEHVSAPWQGFWVSGIEKEQKLVPLRGFYVSSISAKSTLLKGDIILSIDGQSVSEELLAKQFFLAPARFSMIVLRKGEEVNLTIDK